MTTILIISPDPETRRAYQLGLELAGCSTQTTVDAAAIPRQGVAAHAVIVDMIDGSGESLNIVRQLAGAQKKQKPQALIVLLPRGCDPERLPFPRNTFHLIIRRPESLTDAIRRIRDMVQSQRREKKTPSRRQAHSARKPHTPPRQISQKHMTTRKRPKRKPR